MKSMGGSPLKWESEFFRKPVRLLTAQEKKVRFSHARNLQTFWIVLTLLLVLFLTYQTGHFLFSWNKLDITSYRLVSPPQFWAGEVRKILQGHRGNILAMNPALLRQELLNFPEIRDIAVSRMLPSTVEITFQLRQPLFQLWRPGGYEIYDEEGLKLSTLDAPREGLLLLSQVEPQDIPEIVRYSKELNKLRKRISSVGFRHPDGLILQMRGIPELIYPGEGEWADKVNDYLRIRSRWSHSARVIASANLSIDGRIYLEYDDRPGGNGEE